METHKDLFYYLSSMGNLMIAWRKARKNKTLNDNIIDFEKELIENLIALHYELRNKTYKPRQLVNFILRDPKARKISKSDFRDRIIHHALINVVGNIFEKTFIYDSCANQVNKGTLFALKRFDYFKRKVTKNYSIGAFCLKSDIKHYFQEIDHEILFSIIKRKIADQDVLWLIQQILNNNVVVRGGGERPKGMPLGNYTSQFFANVYLNELDYFVKHTLKVKYYVRYVDDFVILHHSAKQLQICKERINNFIKENLRISLHPQKSHIIPLSRGVDFVGFRNYNYHKLLRKRNIISMERKIKNYKEKLIDFGSIKDIYQGWQAYARWANTKKVRDKMKREIIDILWDKFEI